MREPRSGEHESRNGEKEKPLVTLDLNLTFRLKVTLVRILKNRTQHHLLFCFVLFWFVFVFSFLNEMS